MWLDDRTHNLRQHRHASSGSWDATGARLAVDVSLLSSLASTPRCRLARASHTPPRATDLALTFGASPQLSMHSIREMMGVADLTLCRDLFVSFFRDFREVDDMLDGTG